MKRSCLAEIKQSRKKENLPLITVAVTIYNLKDLMKRSVESVSAQTYSNLEILLVDDGSSDGSEKLCDEFALADPRIRVIHKKNGGPSEARNIAIEQAKGEYIAFVDGDDWIEKDMYENMYLAMQKYHAKLAVCAYKEISRDHIQDPTGGDILIFEKDEALESFIREEEEVQIQNAAWNKLFSKELLTHLRFPVGKLYEEIVFTTKLLHEAGRVVYLNQGYYNYVTDREGSIMNAGVNARIFTDQIPLYYEKRAYLQSIGRGDLADIHNFFFYKRLLLHYLELKKNRPQGYRQYCRQIQKLIREEKDDLSPAYKTDVSSKNEEWKMRIFKISPAFYYYFTCFYEKYVIPQKLFRLALTRPLVVIRLSGGLGNQMFQYALYLKMRSLGKKVKIDDRTEYVGRENARPIRLEVFGAGYEVPTETQMRCLTDSFMDPFSRIRRKVKGRNSAEYTEKDQRFDPGIFEKDRVYLTGCWQSEKYFADIRQEVREAFTFRNIQLTEKMKMYEKQIQETESVSLHIRRGDYLQAHELYGGICTPRYYEKAMKQMEEWIPDCHFFVFTNDPAWVKEQYGAKRNLTVVEGNDEDTGYIDMYLMTRCRHYILANSSFSWWGCYLNPSAAKKVIAPSQWFQGRDCRDIYTEEMNTCI